MVYITRSNYQRIKVDFNKIKKSFVPHTEQQQAVDYIYSKRPINWFSDLEASRLILCKIMLLQPKHPLIQKIEAGRWVKVITPSDKYTHAKPPIAPKFHVSEACVYLQSDYLNLELPSTFKERYGEEGVIAFRAWFETVLPEENCTPEQLLKQGEITRFIRKAEARWNVDWSNTEKGLIKAKNSGSEEFHNFNLQELEQRIDKLCQRFEAWKETLLPIELNAIEAFKTMAHEPKLRYSGLKKERLYELLDYFKQTFKYPMQDELLAYYYQTAQESELPFQNSTILEQLGFEACRHCYGRP